MNCVLFSDKVPAELKKALVKPFLKGGGTLNKLECYRPISILQCIGEILGEHIFTVSSTSLRSYFAANTISWLREALMANSRGSFGALSSALSRGYFTWMWHMSSFKIRVLTSSRCTVVFLAEWFVVWRNRDIVIKRQWENISHTKYIRLKQFRQAGYLTDFAGSRRFS